MAAIKLNPWIGLWLMAQGSLLTLTFDGALGPLGSKIAMAFFMIGAVSFSIYRGRVAES